MMGWKMNTMVRLHQGGSRRDSSVLVVPERLELVVIAALPLDSMSHIPGGRHKTNHQHHRVELEAFEADESEASDRRQGTGHQRRPPGAAVSEEGIQSQYHDAVGDEEDHDNCR
jgi:hypothetical protein